LTNSAEFQALFRRGKRIDRPLMVVLWRETAEPRRVGVAVSRQVRGAVGRNRVRRRLREAYRRARGAGTRRNDLVIVGRPGVLRAPFETLVGELRGVLAAVVSESQ